MVTALCVGETFIEVFDKVLALRLNNTWHRHKDMVLYLDKLALTKILFAKYVLWYLSQICKNCCLGLTSQA